MAYRWTGSRWNFITRGYRHVTVGPSGVWAIDNNGDMWWRMETYGGGFTDGNGWGSVMHGHQKWLWVDSGVDMVMAVDTEGRVFKRIISASDLTGADHGGWQEVGGQKLRMIDIGPNAVWGVNGAGEIWKTFLSDCDSGHKEVGRMCYFVVAKDYGSGRGGEIGCGKRRVQQPRAMRRAPLQAAARRR